MIQRYLLADSLLYLAPVKVLDLVRMGKDHDGGYIISDRSVGTADGMLSFGVNDDWSFDQHWQTRKPQDKIHAYDGTVSPTKMSDALQRSYQQFFGGPAEHFPVNVASTTGLGQASFDDAMIRMNRDRVFIKMDIEGGEWQLTDAILGHSNHITGMVIEFHTTDRLRELFLRTIARYQEQFHVIHIHPNTSCPLALDHFPTVIEISFLNRDLWSVTEIRYECHLPDLDQSNVPNTDDVALYWKSR